MNGERPPEVKAKHVARKAMIYVRQSSDAQVVNNQGSTAYQRGQVRYPKAWGWASEQIEVIEDLGLSGTATAHRTGYQRLEAEVRAALIGAIFVSDLTRIGRDAAEYFKLLNLCAIHDTLIVVDGRVYDLRDSSELLTTQLVAVIGEHENRMRNDNMERGRIAKVRSGKAVTAPPVGYTRRADGSWILDPDPSVREALGALFREFVRERSLARTVASLKRLGVKLPRRWPGRPLRWIEPTIWAIQSTLHNPAYKGDYAYRRRCNDHTKGRDSKGRWRTRKASADEMMIVAGHHDAYVSPKQWHEIQATLKLNAPSRQRRNLGPGSALLQGVIRCARHRNWAMSVGYKAARADGSRRHSYHCMGNYAQGEKQCGSVPGMPLDGAVREAVLKRLSPPRIRTVKKAWEDARSDELAEERRRRTELNRMRQAADDLEYRYMSVNPAHRHVAESLEAKLDQAKKELKRREQMVGSVGSSVSIFDHKAFEELVQLCENLRSLWEADTTSNRDRKQIVRTMITHVSVENRTPEIITLRIVWADGYPDTICDARLNRYAYRLMVRLRSKDVKLEEIAQRLNEMGLRTKNGRPWRATSVFQALQRIRASN